MKGKEGVLTGVRENAVGLGAVERAGEQVEGGVKEGDVGAKEGGAEDDEVETDEVEGGVDESDARACREVRSAGEDEAEDRDEAEEAEGDPNGGGRGGLPEVSNMVGRGCGSPSPSTDIDADDGRPWPDATSKLAPDPDADVEGGAPGMGERRETGGGRGGGVRCRRHGWTQAMGTRVTRAEADDEVVGAVDVGDAEPGDSEAQQAGAEEDDAEGRDDAEPEDASEEARARRWAVRRWATRAEVDDAEVGDKAAARAEVGNAEAEGAEVEVCDMDTEVKGQNGCGRERNDAAGTDDGRGADEACCGPQARQEERETRVPGPWGRRGGGGGRCEANPRDEAEGRDTVEEAEGSASRERRRREEVGCVSHKALARSGHARVDTGPANM
ncbi:uncharacterized protein BXZ73DRAFT_78192 [Epithele typhae]|uniref:uncharacterized protein n=1 Tax=Epithele typhae TaxID=378194 RepID=UPI002008B333|nr:uncharacterized protein BXZ73DRAFT_78192 [Epithele typhae]KAH9929036.1 hypothetical protein BXZ73DRAFT_78192 [Epithele typhae]